MKLRRARCGFWNKLAGMNRVSAVAFCAAPPTRSERDTALSKRFVLLARRSIDTVMRRGGTARLALFVAIYSFCAGCGLAHAQSSEHTLPAAVKTRLQAAAIPDIAFTAIALRLADGRVMYSNNANAALQPASTLKVLTSIVALDALGPAHRGRVEFRSAGEIRDGALHGDLVIRGLANPDFDANALRSVLAKLSHQGINDIRGDVILDRHFFVPARTDIGLPPFDETPEFRYNVIPDALMLGSNLHSLEISSTDSALRISANPALPGVRFESALTLVDGSCTDWEDTWQLPTVTTHNGGDVVVKLNGQYPKHCSINTAINVLDRTLYADRLIRAIWSERGGRIVGVVRDTTTGTDANSPRLLTQHESRTLAEFNRDIVKRSDNPITRLTYLTLGAQSDSTRLTTSERAEAVVRRWLAKHRIDATGLVLDNGSGLSRSERITAITLAEVLRVGHQSVWAPEFMAMFPIVGVDGGMRNRLLESGVTGRARLKTGTLRNTMALAGFVPDASGQMHAVVTIVNHDLATAKVGRPIIDAMIDWIAKTDLRTLNPDAPARQ